MGKILETKDFLRATLYGIYIYAGIMVITVITLFIISKTVPSAYIIERYKPPLATVVYDRNGKPVHTFFLERRMPVSYFQIPKHLINAFIAVEDKRFMRHYGLDFKRLVKAVIVDIYLRRPAQGGSTITQQLARNMFLTPQKLLTRKIKEIMLAVRIERTFSKQEILEKYLNLIYFGHGVYGVEAASRFYFGKEIGDLNLAESALLAAIPRSPSLYSPLRNFERARRRQRVVLKLMLKNGFITKEEYEDALDTEISIVGKRESTKEEIAPYFMDMVRRYILSRYGEDFLFKGGGKVYTTLDLDYQMAADSILKLELDKFEKVHHLEPKKEEYVRDSVNPQPPQYLQGALVTLDPNTGEILALVGGRDHDDSEFNRVIQAKRQPGSAFKPFVYLTAIDNGYYPCDKVEDLPIILNEGQENEWKPENYDKKYLGEITLRKALALSRNLATVHLVLEIGPGAVASYARRAGITSYLPPYPSLALGAVTLSPIELATGFSTIANYGYRIRPYFIKKVVDKNGVVLESHEPLRVHVFDSLSTYIVTNMLESTFTEGTARGAILHYGWNRVAAGKTGTTNEHRDSWFIGYTPGLLTCVWVGYDSLRTIYEGASGASMALPIWTLYMKKILDELPDTEFVVPQGIVFAEVCDQSGLLATQYCPVTHIEPFREGDEPQEFCNIHGPKGNIQKLLKEFQKQELEFLRSAWE